jgi:hypothetical protein
MRFCRKKTKSLIYPIKIIIDTREKQPYSFNGKEFETERKKLDVADYKILFGKDEALYIERKKNLDEILLDVSKKHREMFKSQLIRLSQQKHKALFIGDDPGRFVPMLKYKKIYGIVDEYRLWFWVSEICARYNIQLVFLGRNKNTHQMFIEQFIKTYIKYH